MKRKLITINVKWWAVREWVSNCNLHWNTHGICLGAIYWRLGANLFFHFIAHYIGCILIVFYEKKIPTEISDDWQKIESFQEITQRREISEWRRKVRKCCQEKLLCFHLHHKISKTIRRLTKMRQVNKRRQVITVLSTSAPATSIDLALCSAINANNRGRRHYDCRWRTMTERAVQFVQMPNTLT